MDVSEVCRMLRTTAFQDGTIPVFVRVRLRPVCGVWIKVDPQDALIVLRDVTGEIVGFYGTDGSIWIGVH